MDLWLPLAGLLAAIVMAGFAMSRTADDGDKVNLRQKLAALGKSQDSMARDIPGARNRQPQREDIKKIFSHLTGEAFIMRTEKALAQANIPMRVTEFLMLRLIVMAAGAALALKLVQNIPIAAGVAVGLGFLHIPVLAFKRSMRISKFVTQLAEFLTLICNSLRSGQTFMQGVDMACKESREPIASEFRQMLRETNLGMPIDESFQNMYLRVPSDDLKIVLSAFTIQRQVGGNLADILEQVSKTIRERLKIQGQIKVLTTQGKLSGTIVGLMPVGLGVVLTMISPDYMSNLWTTTVGKGMVGVGLFMQLLGCFVIYQICDIEV